MKNSNLRKQAELISRDCIAVRVRLLNRIITNIYDTAMRPYGISLNQASILTIILITGGARYGDICRILHMEKSTLSRNIERMKKNNWIDSIKEGGSGFAVVKITPKGESVLEKAYLAWAKAQDDTLSCLGRDGANALMKLTERFWPMGTIQNK
ncbi:MAG: MarR family winged helix-turn-helix transcriptional regulator [Dissulfurimicrobium sp.]|uniref:MarR family winged helix-turn-helix transcriptional regulator n=1 Tax=Dissulfurimicrobium TaxID=1769732 RepID=UPI001EDBDBBD|nr:MarR family winged helix-turn-helix transcriptional regulator [Dissulfurimicrobium hydrothermale]UKL13682.1 MarR family winged helix-turn-helix transcriptional regulator [Dissulfurimicrobium hydrothermale]